MTTVVTIMYGNTTVLAADRRVSNGHGVAHDTERKIFRLDDLPVAYAGCPGTAEAMVAFLKKSKYSESLTFDGGPAPLVVVSPDEEGAHIEQTYGTCGHPLKSKTSYRNQSFLRQSFEDSLRRFAIARDIKELFSNQGETTLMIPLHSGKIILLSNDGACSLTGVKAGSENQFTVGVEGSGSALMLGALTALLNSKEFAVRHGVIQEEDFLLDVIKIAYESVSAIEVYTSSIPDYCMTVYQ